MRGPCRNLLCQGRAARLAVGRQIVAANPAVNRRAVGGAGFGGCLVGAGYLTR